MKRTALWLVGAAAVAAIVVPFTGCGKKSSIPSVVATVNGKSISGDLYTSQCSRVAGEDVLSELVYQELVITWAEKEKVPATNAQIDKRIEWLKRDDVYDVAVKKFGEEYVKLQLTAQQAMVNLSNKFGKANEDQAKIKEFYDQQVKNFISHGPRVRVAVLMGSDETKINEAAKKLESGDDVFSLAEKYDAQGFPDMRWVVDGKSDDTALDDAVKGLKVGNVSKVYTSQDPMGSVRYCVAKLTKEQPKYEPSYDEIKDQVADMYAQMQFGKWDNFASQREQQMKEADIKVNIPRLAGLVDMIKNPPARRQTAPPPQAAQPSEPAQPEQPAAQGKPAQPAKPGAAAPAKPAPTTAPAKPAPKAP